VIYNLTHMGRDKVVGLLAGVTSRFLLFDERGLDLATSSPEGSIDLRRVFTEPSLLYIGLPQSQLQGSRGQVLLQLIKRVLDKMLLTVAAENGNRLPVHTVFYLDEFPSFGYLPNMDEMTATVRERRGSYIISLQNLAQGQRVYGRDTWDSAVLERSYTEGLKPQDWERRFMEGFRETEKDLLSIEEMQIFPVAQGVVTTPGLPPFRVWLQGIFADAAVAKATGLPVHPYASRRATYLKTSPGKLIETISMVEGISVEEDKSPALPPAAHENPAYLAFLLWIDEVARAAPRVEPDGKGMTLKNIPKGLANPDELGAWVKEGLLERVRGGRRRWARSAPPRCCWTPSSPSSTFRPRSLSTDSSRRRGSGSRFPCASCRAFSADPARHHGECDSGSGVLAASPPLPGLHLRRPLHRRRAGPGHPGTGPQPPAHPPFGTPRGDRTAR